jgi:3D-(3,5/4)-trihydroxycyclohexane-1,2-dione acylhydrolase (decyclizing)
MNPTELVTAMQENLKITVVLSENHGYQSIRQLQMGRAGHSFANEFRERDSKTNRLEGEYLKVDFAKNAEGFGARVWTAQTPEQLRQMLGEARSEKRSCVIVAQIEPHRYLPTSDIWWDVAAAEVTNDPVTAKLRAEFEEGQELQRLYY